jgi:hypothetical protein
MVRTAFFAKYLRRLRVNGFSDFFFLGLHELHNTLPCKRQEDFSVDRMTELHHCTLALHLEYLKRIALATIGITQFQHTHALGTEEQALQNVAPPCFILLGLWSNTKYSS